MGRLGKTVLVLLVLAVVLVGLPIGMPMPSCPQCVLAAGAWCLLVASLVAATAVAVPDRTGERVALLALRLQARLWARRVERPPQRLPQPR